MSVSLSASMEEVTNSFQKRLILTSDESETLVLKQEHYLDYEKLKHCLLVQVYTKTRFNKHAFVDMMHFLWGNSCSIQFKDLNETTFLCHFVNRKT